MSGLAFGALLRLLEALASALPQSWLYATARALALGAMPLLERRRQTVRNNIQRLQPSWEPEQLDAATRRVFQENAMYYVDTALLSRLPPARVLEQHLEIEGLALLESAAGRGRGVILTGAHLSNPELPFQALAALGLEGLALVEPLTSRERLEAMRRRREASGLRFAPADRGGVKEALALLQAGGVVAILVDRDLQGQGVCVPFMRRLAQFPSGAVDLAMRTQSALLFAHAVRVADQRFRVEFRETPPLLRSDNRANDLRANVANLVGLMEPILQAHCDQWRMFQSPWSPCRDTVYHEGGAPRPLSGVPG